MNAIYIKPSSNPFDKPFRDLSSDKMKIWRTHSIPYLWITFFLEYARVCVSSCIEEGGKNPDHRWCYIELNATSTSTQRIQPTAPPTERGIPDYSLPAHPTRSSNVLSTSPFNRLACCQALPSVTTRLTTTSNDREAPSKLIQPSTTPHKRTSQNI